ncbi:hypothetical protein SD71_08575 [Cohnella kolymensis]|uniref:DinB-like domain-containing protein n=2 Tax=Cohnella kolymensis TaxID=1590652 RepID=A0ABR5A5P0_9BACL|nr:hypothetical protein SD71_08575 [Cohnella kolymensis]
MSPTVGLLHSMVTYNYQRLNRLVIGLTQDQIDYKGPNNELNSIAQLLRHLAVVDLHWVYRLQSSEVPSELTGKFGPMYDEEGKLPSVRNVPLHVLLEEYEQIQDMFREVCKKLSDADLDKVVPFENGNSSTIRWGIWHIADHSRHHYSSIVQLKKSFEGEL